MPGASSFLSTTIPPKSFTTPRRGSPWWCDARRIALPLHDYPAQVIHHPETGQPMVV
ncbi:hypothetical protein ACFONI_21430 [Aeromonas media]|uniref:hypothetical protein n=1 Tax=Aeromonas media TaxID=651 RepID=UPI0036111D4D